MNAPKLHVRRSIVIDDCNQGPEPSQLSSVQLSRLSAVDIEARVPPVTVPPSQRDGFRKEKRWNNDMEPVNETK